MTIYDARSGDRVFYDVRDQSVQVAEWLDARTFMLLGSVGEWWDPARIFIAAICIGDVETGRMAIYLGAPVTWLDYARRHAALLPVRRSAYPRVRW